MRTLRLVCAATVLTALIVASSGGSDDIPRAMWNVSLLPTLAGAAAGAVIDALR